MKTIIIEYNKNIPILQRHFEGLTWVYRAAAKKDKMRVNLNECVAVIDGIVYATDGHRCHAFQQEYDDLPTKDYLEDGHYDVLSITKKQIILRKRDEFNFPDVARIFSYRAARRLKPFNQVSRYENYSYFLFYLLNNSTTPFVEGYIRDAYFEDYPIWIERTNNSELAGLVIGNENRLAMIMPLKNAA